MNSFVVLSVLLAAASASANVYGLGGWGGYGAGGWGGYGAGGWGGAGAWGGRAWGGVAAPWAGALGGYGGAHAAPIGPVTSVTNAPLSPALNYRGPVSLAPGQPANILAQDGRPLDTLSVNLDRAAHLTARVVDGSSHLLKKRSLVAPWSAPVVVAPLAPVAHVAPLAVAPVASWGHGHSNWAAGPWGRAW